MAATRFVNPFSQFFSSTPAPYSGGSLTFYAAGTTTPQNTYSDSTLSTPNANPITLNSAGRPAVDIFMSPLSYKVVLKDSSGNTIWTADNYNPAEYATSVCGSLPASVKGACVQRHARGWSP